MRPQLIPALAAILGFSGVAAGAFAAHALQGDARAVELLRTGSSYALWHALAILACYALPGVGSAPPVLFAAGAALFSFSLYALALGAPGWLGIVTPIGGAALLLGWAALGLDAVRGRILSGP